MSIRTPELLWAGTDASGYWTADRTIPAGTQLLVISTQGLRAGTWLDDQGNVYRPEYVASFSGASGFGFAHVDLTVARAVVTTALSPGDRIRYDDLIDSVSGTPAPAGPGLIVATRGIKYFFGSPSATWRFGIQGAPFAGIGWSTGPYVGPPGPARGDLWLGIVSAAIAEADPATGWAPSAGWTELGTAAQEPYGPFLLAPPLRRELYAAYQLPGAPAHPTWSGTTFPNLLQATVELGFHAVPDAQECSNLHTPRGHYLAANVTAAGTAVEVRRADRSIPPFATLATLAGLTQPHLSLARDQRIRLLAVTSAGAVVEYLSDDEGETWRGPTTVFPSGDQPRAEMDGKGATVRAAYVDGGGSGPIQANRQMRGQTTWSPTSNLKLADGSDLLIEGRGYSLSAANDDAERWILMAVPAGGTEFAHYVSTDEGRTWRLLSS